MLTGDNQKNGKAIAYEVGIVRKKSVMFSKIKSQTARSEEGIQSVDIMVNDGYTPVNRTLKKNN